MVRHILEIKSDEFIPEFIATTKYYLKLNRKYLLLTTSCENFNTNCNHLLVSEIVPVLNKISYLY